MNSPTPPATEKAAQPTRSMAWRVEAFLERTFIWFCLYTLSIGPLYWQWVSAQAGGPYRLLAFFYLPLQVLAETIPPFGGWLNWYLHWWIFG